MTTAGNEKVLHAFGAAADDGYGPSAGLVWSHGRLYGTTTMGGAAGFGVAFALKVNGAETLLHVFSDNDDDGFEPVGTLVEAKGNFYGSSLGGGYARGGTIFAISPNNTTTALYSFQGGSNGALPNAKLTGLGDRLFGTTAAGGGDSGRFGTVFYVALTGGHKTIYDFTGETDGMKSAGGLLRVSNTFYGTTQSGGVGHGTVFSITPTGVFKTVYAFHGSAVGDGEAPTGGLVAVGGIIYGTTPAGGKCGSSKTGCGTVFSLTPAGTETVVHSFIGRDGEGPEAGLLALDGKLYGTTARGGTSNNGTVFEIMP